MFCSIPWLVAFDPLPMGAPGAAENGGVWLGAEAPAPEEGEVVNRVAIRTSKYSVSRSLIHAKAHVDSSNYFF